MKLKLNQSAVFSVQEDCRYLLQQLYAGLQSTWTWKKASGSCFCAALFLEQAFTMLGMHAQVLPCYAIAVQDDAVFKLGYKNEICSPIQKDGHVVCLVDDCMLVDFGLKNVQRYGWPDFPAAVACKGTPENIFPTRLMLDSRRTITWFNDWVNPDTDSILEAHKPISKKLFNEYKEVTLWKSMKTISKISNTTPFAC